MPTAIFLCFGNRFDVWGVWYVCRRRKSSDINSIAIRVTLNTTLDITRDDLVTTDNGLKSPPSAYPTARDRVIDDEP